MSFTKKPIAVLLLNCLPLVPALENPGSNLINLLFKERTLHNMISYPSLLEQTTGSRNC